jgi:hypothetical protein
MQLQGVCKASCMNTCMSCWSRKRLPKRIRLRLLARWLSAWQHAVVPWNLPSNPVDLEQRESRVHRYKGHAVRKNVARVAQSSSITIPAHANPWPTLFAHAEDQAGRQSDIGPYWVVATRFASPALHKTLSADGPGGESA